MAEQITPVAPSTSPSIAQIQNAAYTYAADAEASDAYAITLASAPAAYAAGQTFRFKANTANTGAASLNVNSLGAKTIKKNHDQDLADNDIESGSVVTVIYDGTNFQLQNADANLNLDEVADGSTYVRSQVEYTSAEKTTVGNQSGTNTGDEAAADESTAGVAEVATTAEINTGTDTGRIVAPDQLAGSYAGTKCMVIAPVASDTAVATGDGTYAFTVPSALNGMNLVNVVFSVHTKGITGTTDIQIRRRRAGADADMLSTKVTIGDEFFASDEVIDGTNDDVQTGDQIYIDVDAVHSGTAPNGLSGVLEFRLP